MVLVRRDMALMHYLATFLIISIFRTADLYLTWRITPDLKSELNPIVRWLGWRWNIIVNLALCAITPLLPWQFLLAGCLVSAVVIVCNARILFRIRKHLTK